MICLPKENPNNKNVVVIEVKHETLTQGNIRIGKLINGFIPEKAIGSSSRKKGKGRELTLYLSGLNKIIKTDIPEDKKLFRQRAEIREFSRFHNLQIGDKLYLEKIDNYIFRLRPLTKELTFIDLFAGIGGMRLAFEKCGAKCVFSSEWDKQCQITYHKNFGEWPAGDITKINEAIIPDHDILVAGFPCQPFSIAGVSKKNSLGKAHGFADKTQGTLFFDILRILKEKQPRAFLLENVRNLKSHDGGKTFDIIYACLNELGYHVVPKVIDGALVVPQHRERIIIIGTKPALDFEFPKENEIKKYRLAEKLGDILEKNVPSKYTLTDHLWNYLQNYAEKHRKAGNGFGFGLVGEDDISRTLSARYYKDGSEILIKQFRKNPRRLTPRECARLMGFPETFEIIASDTQAYRQFGNSVVIPAIEAVASNLTKCLIENRILPRLYEIKKLSIFA